ncbi:MAG: glycoside hydrolase family 3 C-terminal domain-containing protein [Salinisphaeraceae bacterium]|nr:glycoside hydrolase family 3 C-terminal domain-containing protein [Salinisphaeraceae bacterium]
MVRMLWVAILALILSSCGGGSSDDDDTGSVTSGESRCGSVEERPWCDTSKTDEERAAMLVEAMTLEQKVDYLAGDDPASAATCEPYCGVVNGIPELGIPPLRMTDGPVGVRGGPATALPIPLALAATFNPTLAYETGALVGNETRHKGNDLVHAPVADLVRNPLAGRTFETFGEDVLLATRFTVEWIKGVQDEGVLANVKHYLMNTQEGVVGVPPLAAAVGGRNLVNVVIDERTLRETYLPPYEAAVIEADVASMMCAYNLLNAEPACSSPYLLQQLYEEWGFDGFLVTDYYFAQKDTIQTANTAAVIEMPFGFFFRPELLQLAVQSGQVAEETIDKHMRDIFRTLFRFGFFDRPAYVRDESQIDQPAHAAVARRTIEEGSVLLKNAGVLPLSSDIQSIAVIGLSALERPTGGGSSFVTPFQFTTPLDGILQRAGEDVQVAYADGRDQQAAANLAAQADVAIVFANALATEGVDKFCLSLDCTLADTPDSLLLNLLGPGAEVLDLVLDPVLSQSPVAEILEQAFAPILLGGQPLPVSHRNQDALISTVAAANANTVVVLQTGGPVLTPWRDEVNAILEIWFAGQEVAPAVAAILFGDTDPGGRLPVSFPINETDHVVAGDPTRYPGVANQAMHSEGVFIGYRWHDENGVEPAYPFGFGLSYTQFELSNLGVTNSGNSLSVSTTVRNTGSRAGWAVPQLYLGLPSTDVAPQPPLALKGFEKLWLEAGESRNVTFDVDSRGLSYCDEASNGWVIAPGCYQIRVGQSSRDLPLQSEIAVGGGSCP